MKEAFVGKMKSLDAMSNTKEDEKKEEKAKKNGKAQKNDKKESATKEDNVVVVEYENVQAYDVEAVNSARMNGGKWEYEVKWVGYDEITWEPFSNLVTEACRESICFLDVFFIIQMLLMPLSILQTYI